MSLAGLRRRKSLLPLNQRVQGSNPCTPTNDINDLRENAARVELVFELLGATRGPAEAGLAAHSVRDLMSSLETRQRQPRGHAGKR